ncbi:uncharacterized protein ACLA_045590 [Aspergillus clavatus NRRL 1]|uniref:Uncharacterized protein n=1 Tax=Aspergillus clavatus (strain ATCC 1007 / CBS 513.65 / DSM 816 / NCTC 3887 / NRRL 1 / QM 1276 / 107) TaxID=344612 RepID=A1CGT9_ASPCL|nr:uncharacterized protein ACLA_045590 [Aspergillus clavatus NRRL 1]EAW10094.1 conserved hypothetical protein [Aspergillus clavatus NRRL 1]
MAEDGQDASSNGHFDQETQSSGRAGFSATLPARRSSGRYAAGEQTGSSGSSHPSRGGQQPQNPQSKSFEFVLVTDNESRRQVRRHAMRQYMRQRRLDSIARLETPRLPIGGWVSRQAASEVSTLNSPSSQIEDPLKDVPTDEENIPPVDDVEYCALEAGTEPSMALVSQSSSIKSEESSPLPFISYRTPDPLASPGHGAIQDPFSSYPIPVSHTDHKLIQHFIVTYPSMMYKFADSVANNPMLEIFRQIALHDGLPFQAMLAIASKHRAGVEGKTDSVQSLTHKMRALRMMNERMQADSQGLQDGTIYAVATMAVIEKWSKDASIERMHCKGLASMVRNRGGMRGMRASNPFLEKVLYWVDFSCAPNATYTSCLPWTGAIPDTLPESLDFLVSEEPLAIPHHLAQIEGSENLYNYFRAGEDFLRFFRRLYELENAMLSTRSETPGGHTTPRVKRFSPGTQLHSILTMLPDYDHGICDIRFIDEYTCMACLLFLAVALYDSYQNSTDFDHYLEWLDMEIQKLSPRGNPSIASVLWLFLNNGGYAHGQAGDTGERCWAVSRMVRIAKRLEWKHQGTIWDRLRQVLINFILTQQECALGSDSIDDAAVDAQQQRRGQPREYFWDEDEMREEILGTQQAAALAYSEVGTPAPLSSGIGDLCLG